MQKHKYLLASLLIITLLGASWPFNWLFSHPNPESPESKAWINKEFQILRSQASNLSPNVLLLSLKAYVRVHKEGYSHKPLLTVIDYSKPSIEKRLWVFDVKRGQVLMNTWVSHGKNSGDMNANSFSNANGSLKSSIGVFITDEPYTGGHGIALRMRGLEKGFNDHAYNRNIVFHGAAYVNGSIARHLGRMGRSWGCPAVSTDSIKPLVDTIKENTVVFAYYPDKNWLKNSRFLV